jgi:hypothetical protein
MDRIKIIRLQSGEDVICEYSEGDDGFVTLSNPFAFIIRRDRDFKCSIFITPWLPIDVIEKNVAQIFTSDILTIMTPVQLIKDYYHKMVFEYYNGESDLPEVDMGNTEITNDVTDIDDSEFYDVCMNEVDEVLEEYETTIKSNKTIH